MGQIRTSTPVLLFLAIFSSQDAAFSWAKRRLQELFGPVELESEPFDSETFTGYYAPTMGARLPKRFWAFRDLIDPAELPRIKILTNAIEEEYSALSSVPGGPSRLLNLDPGYVDLGKFVLASTKDHAHRIYLSQGIFAETTLQYTQKAWKPLPWTYPDYQTESAWAFLTRCRDYLTASTRRKTPGIPLSPPAKETGRNGTSGNVSG